MIRVEDSEIIVHGVARLVVPKYVAKVVEFVIRNPYCRTNAKDFIACLKRLVYTDYEEWPEYLKLYVKPRYLRRLREFWVPEIESFIIEAEGIAGGYRTT